MRGVVSCGMAAALAYLGLSDSFDAVYGASAGALNGSFFVTGKMPLGPTIYYQDINNSQFISLSRVFGKGPIMDLNFLLENVLTEVKPLNWEHIIGGEFPLHIVMASLTEGRSEVISKFETKEELFSALRASATIPYIAGPPVRIGDDLMFDASLFEPLPYMSAIADGCSHVLVLASRPRGRYRKPPSLLERWSIGSKLERLSDSAAVAFFERADSYRRIIDFLTEHSEHPKEAQPYSYLVQPNSCDIEISQLERKKDKLILGAISGMRAVFSMFAPEERLSYFEVLTPLDRKGQLPRAR